MGLVVRAVWIVLVASVAITSGSPIVLAASPRFVIEPPDCTPTWFDGRTLESMLRADTSSTTRAFIAVTVPDCRRDDLVEFTVIRSGRSPSAGQANLNDVPESARLRSVAMMVVEHLDAPELARPGRPVKATKTQTPQNTRPILRWELSAQPVLHVGLRRGEALFGAAAAVALWRSRLGAQLEAEAATGAKTQDGGRARAWLVALQFWPHVRASAAALTWSVGPNLGGGLAQLISTPNASNQSIKAERLAMWLGGRARIGWPLSDRFALRLDVEGRGYLRGLAGSDAGSTFIGISGPYARVALGAAWTMR